MLLNVYCEKLKNRCNGGDLNNDNDKDQQNVNFHLVFFLINNINNLLQIRQRSPCLLNAEFFIFIF